MRLAPAWLRPSAPPLPPLLLLPLPAAAVANDTAEQIKTFVYFLVRARGRPITDRRFGKIDLFKTTNQRALLWQQQV